MSRISLSKTTAELPATTRRTHSSATQVDGFLAVREAHRSEMVEDYCELIAELTDNNGAARPVDIARCLGVTQPTVSKNLAKLKREGYISHERYRSVFLTESGRALAEICRRRHRIVVAFLLALGLDKATAEQDAEGIEHHVSEHTLSAFQRFVENKERQSDADQLP